MCLFQVRKAATLQDARSPIVERPVGGTAIAARSIESTSATRRSLEVVGWQVRNFEDCDLTTLVGVGYFVKI